MKRIAQLIHKHQALRHHLIPNRRLGTSCNTSESRHLVSAKTTEGSTWAGGVFFEDEPSL